MLVLSAAYTPLPNNYTLIKQLPLQGKYITTDKFGNAYVVNEKNQALKINNQGDIVKYHNINSFGQLSLMDATNPLKIILFFEEYATLVLLDRTMTETGRLTLYEKGFNQVNAVCSSQDNHIWIYDAVEYKLKKLDDNLNVVEESEDITTQLGIMVSPTFILQQDNYIYLNDPEKGIFVFDLFGTYYKIIPLKGITDFQKLNDQFIYYKNGKLNAYNLATLNLSVIDLPVCTEEIIDVHIQSNRLYLLHKKGLALYAY